MSKEWQKLQFLVPVRAAEMLRESQGNSPIPERWAFIAALDWRDKSGLHRNSLQYRFADAVVHYMMENWSEKLG